MTSGLSIHPSCLIVTDLGLSALYTYKKECTFWTPIECFTLILPTQLTKQHSALNCMGLFHVANQVTNLLNVHKLPEHLLLFYTSNNSVFHALLSVILQALHPLLEDGCELEQVRWAPQGIMNLQLFLTFDYPGFRHWLMCWNCNSFGGTYVLHCSEFL